MTKRDFEGKVVAVTGGGVGIGLEIIKIFAASGAIVCSADLVVTDGMRKATEASGGFSLQSDLGKPEGPPKFVQEVIGKHGKIDVLVNNLGASPVHESFLKTTDEHWERIFNVNLYSMVRATRAALPSLMSSRGVVVSIASVLAREPRTIQPDYCATKAALLNLNQTLATEFGPAGVRFVCISPGATLTPQWTNPGGQVEQFAKQRGITPDEAMRVAIPKELGLSLQRFVQPDEIAKAVKFAASDAASAITGSEIVVDAGMRNSV
jgi:NAD(P)-dependent dehydrogenase (short-subunit alcohol dehydrogenase family)